MNPARKLILNRETIVTFSPDGLPHVWAAGNPLPPNGPDFIPFPRTLTTHPCETMK